ncbi:hypothetical protein F8M41_004421 [Gigaspora margarita]|uniref:Uncharacterized protein n=1 Tax=Gigaspora margarita TaxID=4874 RepID=A0A8H4ES26_GIGMA|nr:hypothetical protein F8M41_004421 [Gigaspora margarita]
MEYFESTTFYNVNILDWLISQENFPGNHHSPQDAINAFKKDISSFYKNELERKTVIISKLQVRILKTNCFYIEDDEIYLCGNKVLYRTLQLYQPFVFKRLPGPKPYSITNRTILFVPYL